MKSKRNTWMLLVFLIIGLFLGGLLGELAAPVLPFLTLSSPTYGLYPPLSLALGPLTLVFGITLSVSVAMVFGLMLAYLAYRAL
ncbi:MAG: hypothetical protein DDT37_00633 [Firmicutes bacterium]|nr:hypothetical protein [candidate division NPL-UPA2 bacterium]